MEFNIEKSAFQTSIQKVQSIIERRSTNPFLNNVKLTAATGNLEVIATDLEVGIRDLIGCDVPEFGSILVSAKKLYEVLKELPENLVKFKLEENNWIKLSCGSSEFRLFGSSDVDYPKLPDVDESNLTIVPGDLLDNLTKKVVYAVSHDENRRVLGGVLFKVDDEAVRMIATDGHRLAYVETPNTLNMTPFEVIIPQKAVHEIQRMVGAGGEEFRFGINNNHLVFKVGCETVISRLVEGMFPNYSIVIPKECRLIIKVNKESLMLSLRRVSLFSDIKARGIKMNISDNLLVISANTPEFGEARDQIPIAYSEEPFTVGFNVTYLLELLKTIDAEDVAIRVNNPSGPVEFRPGIESELRYLAIVMPMIV